MLALEHEVASEFFKYNLKAYFSIQQDCYRVTLFDLHNEQTMMFIPKNNSNQVTEIVQDIVSYAKRKYPELFM